MFSFQNKIHLDYATLYEHGYKDQKFEDRGAYYSSLSCEKKGTGVIFNFTIEKGKLSIALTSKSLLSNNKVSKYGRFYELFYIYKYFHPEVDFKEINSDIFPNFVLKNLSKIEELFLKENEDKTIEELNKIQLAYNKIRWKK